ncbi:MAG: hypothetical protein H6747_09370 [Deltaproteobacteria bacterium]|nr:hypothetical protein [Deltaproteobacteria bacterium]
MEKPNAETVAHYEALLPADPRVAPGKMFGHVCAFTGGHMFFGTFAQTLIARVGPDRVPELLDAEGLAQFEPMPGRPWREYVQFDPRAMDPDEARTLVADALEFTAGLPPKPRKVKAAKKK